MAAQNDLPIQKAICDSNPPVVVTMNGERLAVTSEQCSIAEQHLEKGLQVVAVVGYPTDGTPKHVIRIDCK